MVTVAGAPLGFASSTNVVKNVRPLRDPPLHGLAQRRRIQKLTEVLPSGAPFGWRRASGMCRATASF